MAEAQDRAMTERTGGRRSPDEIRADIERTRSEMHETVDALDRRLSAGQIFEEVWHRVRSGSGDGSSIMKEHPVPLALMGLGLGWLAVEKATQGNESHRSSTTLYDATGATYGSPTTPGAFLTEDEEHGKLHAAKEKVSSLGDKASSKAHEARARMSEKTHDATERARHTAEEAKGRAREAASSARETARSTMDRARAGFDRVNQEQPLALGAIAFGVGLAAGMAAPSTRWEDEHLGDASDRVKDSAKHTARELEDEAREIGGELKAAAREAGHEAQQTLESSARETEGRSAGERVGDAIDRASDTIRNVAERHELDSEGLRMRADEAKQTAREGMRDMKDAAREGARDVREHARDATGTTRPPGSSDTFDQDRVR